MTRPDLTPAVLARPADAVQAEATAERLRAELPRLGLRAEVRLVEVERADAFGTALAEAFADAAGEYLLTLPGGVAPDLDLIGRLWAGRGTADVLVAEPCGARRRGSRLEQWLGGLFGAVLGLPTRELFGGPRLYRSAVVRGLAPRLAGRWAAPEVLVRLHADGWRIGTVPAGWRSALGIRERLKLRAVPAALGALGSLWRLRTSILSADYDDRAYDSPIPLQRYWQRTRFKHITELSRDQGRTLDVGCGSSRIIGALSADAVCLDVLLRKLRYARKFGRPLVQGSGFHLPFRDATFDCVICSQVIEHVPRESPILAELDRVLKPGGRLVLGTPDYARWEWVYIEKLYARVAPGGYAEEHITHYTQRELVELFERRGYTVEAVRYILRGELILALRKPATV